MMLLTQQIKKALPLHCFNQSATGRGEEMIFVCAVMDPIFEAKVIEYQQALQQGKMMRVKFSLQYVRTIGFQYCMANNDPDHLVTIAAKLLAINES